MDVYSENFVGIISPRISFSYDLEQDQTTNNPINVDFPCKLDQTLADSIFDFAFNVDRSVSFQPSTADELFSDGKILPTTIKNEKEEEKEIKIVPIPEPVLMPCLDTPEAKKKSLKEYLEESVEEEEEEPNTMLRTFWKFPRSNSLNSDRNQSKGLIGSRKLLPRSRSTGKFLQKIVEDDDIEKPNRKFFWKFIRSNSLNPDHVNVNCHVKAETGFSKILRKSHSTSDRCQYSDCKSNSEPFRRSSSVNCDTRIGANQGLIGSVNFLSRSFSTGSTPKKKEQLCQKRQVKSTSKGCGYGNYNNNNVRVSHVLNLPSPYISRVSVDLFGFGSFCKGNTKDKKKRK